MYFNCIFVMHPNVIQLFHWYNFWNRYRIQLCTILAEGERETSVVFAPVWVSWPPVGGGWEWSWCLPPLSPAFQSTSHYCTSATQGKTHSALLRRAIMVLWALLANRTDQQNFPHICLHVRASHLFNVQKVFGFKVYGSTLNRTVLI